MNNYTIKTEQYKGYTISIEYDTDAPNPRTEWDNASHFICWHRRYDLGDKHNCADPQEFYRGLARELDAKKFDALETKYDADKIDEDTFYKECLNIIEKNAVIMPLRLYDHSGISISASGGYPYNDMWDSMSVGYAYMTRADVVREFGAWNKGTKEKARKLILAEIENYDDYLTGQVYGYVIREGTDDDEGEILDSCWGYFGEVSELLKETRSIVDYRVNKKQERAEQNNNQLAQLKAFFRIA